MSKLLQHVVEGKPTASTEAIKPQLNDEYKDIIVDILIRNIKKVYKGEVTPDTELELSGRESIELASTDMVDELDAYVYKRLGLPTKTFIDPMLVNAYAYPLLIPGYDQLAGDAYLNSSGYDISSFPRHMRRALKEAKKVMGSGKLKVDEKRARILGLPNNNMLHTGLGGGLFMIGLTPLEIAAVYTHELGHHFTYIEYSSRIVKDDITLTDELMKAVKDGKDGAYREFTIKLLEKENKAAAKEVEEALKRGDNIYAGLKTLQVLVSKRTNEAYEKAPRVIPGRTSTMNELEALADDFATKLGLGTYVVSGLAKVVPHISHLDEELNDALGYVSVMSYSLLAIIPLLVGMLLLQVSPQVGLAIILIGLFLTVIISNLTTDDYTTTPDRSHRVKRNLIRFIKDSEVPKDYMATMIKLIDRMDKYLQNKEVINAPEMLVSIGKLLAPGLSKEMKNLAFFQLLEDLNANDLYYLHAKLDNM